MFVLVERGKPEDAEKNSEQRQEPTTNSTHMSNITLIHNIVIMIFNGIASQSNVPRAIS